MANDISIASNALLLLGHEPISSFEDSTAGATIASNLYQSSYESQLEGFRWRFATKKANLPRLSETPMNEFTYQFQLPIDLLYLQRTIDNINYEIFGDRLYSNSLKVEINYTYNIEAPLLPAYYVKALEFFLAAQFAISLTGNINLKKEMESMYLFQLKKAQFADSTQRPQDTFQSSPYTDVRR